MVKSLNLYVTVALFSIELPAGYSNKKINNNNKNSKCVADFPSSRARFLFSLFLVSQRHKEASPFFLSTKLLIISLSQAYFADGDKVSTT